MVDPNLVSWVYVPFSPMGNESVRKSMLKRSDGTLRSERLASLVIVSIAVVLAVASACVPAPPPPPAQPLPPLRELADAVQLRIGATLEPRQIDDVAYASTLAREFNALTAENAMKWYTIQPTRGVFDFGGADAVLAFAETNGMEVRGHTLLWAQDAFTPGWVKAITDPDEMREVVRDHIRTVLGRYRGRIHRWDVVNEPLDAFGLQPSDSVFRRVLGPGWIAEVYRMAHEVDPTVELWLNEYGTDLLPIKHDALLALLRQLLADGVPLHGVGLQTHLQWAIAPDRFVFEAHLRDYAALGLEVAITELDIRVFPFIPGHLERQAEAYRTVITACLAVEACNEVTLWGVTDRDSWLDAVNPLPRPSRPLLFDDTFAPKPAYRAVAETLAGSTGHGEARRLDTTRVAGSVRVHGVEFGASR